MARQLWLLRHAEAEPHGTREDSERRLTVKGELQARTAGLALAAMQARFEAILVSPKVRAHRTAELAAERWEAAQRELLSVHPPLASGFTAPDALEAMAGLGTEARVLLVGHEPDLSRVVGELCGGHTELKKGGLAMVRLHGGSGQLAVLMRPVELALLVAAPSGGQ